MKGNTIGTGRHAATQPLGNGDAGIELDPSCDRLRSSAASRPAKANAIAWNEIGVLQLRRPQRDPRQSDLLQPARLGIDNDPAGVTKNDAGDADTGANQLQNFPFISSVDYGATSLTVHGILKSSPEHDVRPRLLREPVLHAAPAGPAAERLLSRLDSR